MHQNTPSFFKDAHQVSCFFYFCAFKMRTNKCLTTINVAFKALSRFFIFCLQKQAHWMVLIYNKSFWLQTYFAFELLLTETLFTPKVKTIIYFVNCWLIKLFQAYIMHLNLTSKAKYIRKTHIWKIYRIFHVTNFANFIFWLSLFKF